jgi:thiamine pyrophosphate-dependent acetolactate synthase large subunit-like protein
MKLLDYMRIIADTVSEDTLIVASHTKNIMGWLMMKKSNAYLGDLNMGLTTPVALGLAMALPHRRVLALDSDGGATLFTSAMLDLASQKPANLTVVIHDNSQLIRYPSLTAGKTDLAAMAKGAGIENVHDVDNLDDFKRAFVKATAQRQLHYIVARSERVRLSTPEGLIKQIGMENTIDFVRRIEREEGVSIIGGGWRMDGLG